MTPEIVTIRPGVAFTPNAAKSFMRAEARLNRQIDVNSTYREWFKQLGMYNAWEAYVNGTGPKPNHSRAIHPRYSSHCLGLGLDSDDWTRPGFIAFMAEHGFIRTAPNDPTEQHHFEYQISRDKYLNEPIEKKDEDDDMFPIVYVKPSKSATVYEIKNGRKRALSAIEWQIINDAYAAAGVKVPYAWETVTTYGINKIPNA